LIFENADGAYERGALLALAWPKVTALRPSCELAMRREFQRSDLFAGQAGWFVVHDASSRTVNSIASRSP
jgi:hypothetical protein